MLRRVGLYLLIVLVTLACAELLYRGVTGGGVLTPTNYVARAVERHVNPVGPSVIHERLGWSMREGFIAPEKWDKALTIGRYGLRMNEPGVQRDPPRNAILAVGDSFTAGSEEADDGSWPAALERRLGEVVLNGGVGGYGVDQIVLRGEYLAERLSPRAVIYSYLSGDVLRSAFAIYGGYKPYFVLTDDGGLRLEGIPVEKKPPRIDRLGVWRTMLGHSKIVHDAMMAVKPRAWIGREMHYRQVSTNEEAVEIACRLTERVRRTAAEEGFAPYFVMQFGGDEVMRDAKPWYAEDVVACIRAAGFEILDTFDALRAVAEADVRRFESLYNVREGVAPGQARFGHMSAEGNEFIASLIAERFFEPRGGD